MTTDADYAARALALRGYMHGLVGQLGVAESSHAPPDPIATARCLYLNGAIDLETFEARLNAAFGLAAA